MATSSGVLLPGEEGETVVSLEEGATPSTLRGVPPPGDDTARPSGESSPATPAVFTTYSYSHFIGPYSLFFHFPSSIHAAGCVEQSLSYMYSQMHPDVIT